MRILMIVGLALLATPSVAQDGQSRVVEGCVAAIEAMNGKPPDPIHLIEDFSELDPPRARIRYGTPWETTVACVFEQRESPLGLDEMCVDTRCMSEDRSKLRFEEIDLLMRRAGY